MVSRSTTSAGISSLDVALADHLNAEEPKMLSKLTAARASVRERTVADADGEPPPSRRA